MLLLTAVSVAQTEALLLTSLASVVNSLGCRRVMCPRAKRALAANVSRTSCWRQWQWPMLRPSFSSAQHHRSAPWGVDLVMYLPLAPLIEERGGVRVSEGSPSRWPKVRESCPLELSCRGCQPSCLVTSWITSTSGCKRASQSSSRHEPEIIGIIHPSYQT